MRELRREEGGRGGALKCLRFVRRSWPPSLGWGPGQRKAQTTWFSATAHVATSFFSQIFVQRMRVLGRPMSLRTIVASRTRVIPIIPPVVRLNEVEDRLCSLLDEFVQHLKQQDGIQTTCRFAGGWVRDKVRRNNPDDLRSLLLSCASF